MDTEKILKILREGTREERLNWVESLPESNMKSFAVSLIVSEYPDQRIVGLVSPVMEYCNGQDPETGMVMAEAVHEYAVEVYDSDQRRDLLPITLSNLACQFVSASNLLGRSDEVVEFCDQYIPFYEELGEHENLPTLIMARVSALLNLNEVDEADQEIKQFENNWLGKALGADIEFHRLKEKIKNMKASHVSVKSENSSSAANGPENNVFELFKNRFGELLGDSDQDIALGEAIKKIDPNNRLDMESDEGFRQGLEILKKGEKFLTKGGSGQSEWTVKGLVREASSIFKFEDKPAREKIENSMKDLNEGLSWARENGHIELENDALYGLYLCYSRLDQPSPAADQLINIRTNLEDTRSGIKDPLERGGVFRIYPHLFDVLCEKLYMSGRTEELLESIEASKGRGVADILTQKSGTIVADSSIYDAAKALPDLTRRFQFHYLTFYMDEERTYAVLVCKDGTIHPADPIEIMKSELREVSQFVNPQLWGTGMEHDPSIKVKDVSVCLAPLVEWLGDLLESGSISTGDHICYSADESINNIPIQYLMFNGKPLVEYFSVSRIHNSFHLQQVLSKPTKGHPKSSNSFIVPSQQDTEKEDWETLQSHFYEPAYNVKKLLKGSILKEKDCDFDHLRKQKLKNKVLHFSTHGYFPTANESQAPNPFYQSGLILACEGELPDVGVLVKDNEKFLLTPEKILNFKLEFNNSHVSMMACVSGLSKEGLGGDALGLDWALIQAGAASILASHWHVRAELAAMFFERFYHYWLEKKKTRAHSYSLAVKDLSSKPENLEHPFEWAAFSLSGDWR